MPEAAPFPYTPLRMRLSTLAVSALIVVPLGCVSAPPIHPRAVENNQLCAEYLTQGLLDKAEIHCDLGIQFSPHYSDLYVNKGLIAQKRGQFDRAKDLYIEALRKNNEQAQAYNNLGVIYGEVEGNWGRATAQYERALRVNPDYLEARYNMAKALMRLGKKDEARKQYGTVIAVAPNLADPYHDLGVMALEDGDVEEAISQLRKAVELDPQYANAWLSLGNAYAEAAKFRESVDAFTSCLEADPENAPCRNNIALVNRKAALLDPSLKEVQQSQAVENTAPALYMLATQYRDRGLRNEEERTYKKCLKLDARFAPCHYGLYTVFSDDRRDRDATIACKNFLKFGTAEEYPTEFQTCERFLSANAP